MSKYWSETVRGLKPYTPGEQPKDRKYIKLNTNENPYPPSPKAVEAMRAAIGDSLEPDGNNLRLYPDPDCEEVRIAVAEQYGLKKEQVYVGNGSDELLAFAFIAFFSGDRPILFPDITYTFYPVYASLFNIPYSLIALNEDFTLPVERFAGEHGGIIFPNPNAPTGLYLQVEAIRDILERNRERVVVVDEAYIDFGGESAVKYIHTYPNLLVVRTLSKSHSLAGLRVGLAIGSEELIEGLDRVKNSFNSYTIDRVALAGAVEAIKDTGYCRENCARIIRTREYVSAALADMGFRVILSRTNFIFISHPAVPAKTIFGALREKGVLVRYFDKPRIDNFLRVSMGAEDEMDVFLRAAKQIVQTKI